MISMKSLAKRHYFRNNSKPHRNFLEDLRSFQLINNFHCKAGRQRLPHCLHVNGVRVVALPPLCSSGINLLRHNQPREFAVSDDHPCHSTCCAKTRKEVEDRLIKEIQSAGLHFRHNKLLRGDVIGVARECYQEG